MTRLIEQKSRKGCMTNKKVAAMEEHRCVVKGEGLRIAQHHGRDTTQYHHAESTHGRDEKAEQRIVSAQDQGVAYFSICNCPNDPTRIQTYFPEFH